MKKFTVSAALIFFITTGASARKFSDSFPNNLLKQPFSCNLLPSLSKGFKELKSGSVGLNIFPCFSCTLKMLHKVQHRLLMKGLFLFQRICRTLNRGDIPFAPMRIEIMVRAPQKNSRGF